MRGSCLCGEVSFEVAATPIFVNHCHCSMCRRYSGTAFATWAHVPPGSFSYCSGADLVGDFRTPGGGTWGFCRNCGSPIPVRVAGAPTVQVPVGTLDAGEELKPSLHMFIESRVPWFPITDELPQFEGKVPFEQRVQLARARNR